MAMTSPIAILGTGLLGASVGLSLKKAGFSGLIRGYGRREVTVERARHHGAIDEGVTELGEAVRDAGLVIVAVPLGQVEGVFAELGEHLGEGAVVTDVGSTKQSVLEAARRHLPGGGRHFVGSHPMAGSELQGPEAARAELLPGRPCIITPESDTDAAALELVEHLWALIGMRVLRMSAREHDEQTASISHLPHAAAALLVQVACELGGWEIASTGFRDTTRLASSNPPMRSDILMANREAIVRALRTFEGQIEDLAGKLEAGDREGILGMLEASKQRRDTWLAKWEEGKP